MLDGLFVVGDVFIETVLGNAFIEIVFGVYIETTCKTIEDLVV